MDVHHSALMFALAMLGLLLSLALAAANSALSTITRQRLNQLVESGHWGADVALELQQNVDALRATMRTVRLAIAALLTATLLAGAGDAYPPVVVALAVVVALLLAEVVGYALGRRAFATLAPAMAPVLRAALWLTAPLRLVLSQLWQRLAGQAATVELAQRQEEEEERLLATLMGEGDASLPDDQREMLQNIVDLEQTNVREVMVPRPDLVILSSDTTLQEALDTIIEAGHSRIPAYEGNVDNIVGILYAKDLFGDLREGRLDLPIRDRLRPPLFVPASRAAVAVLEQMQHARIHLAIVLDEYGGTAGLVTIEDILEEIVGEIQDEYDREEAHFIPLGDDEALVSGRFDIDDLNGAMGLDLPTDENDTVGGLVYSALGRVPSLKDAVTLDAYGVTFYVVQMAGHRILKVRVTVERASSDASAQMSEGNGSTPLPYTHSLTVW